MAGQPNLLQLHLNGNTLAGVGSALALVLANLRRLEQLSIGSTAAELAPFGHLLMGSLASLRKVRVPPSAAPRAPRPERRPALAPSRPISSQLRMELVLSLPTSSHELS